MKSSESPIAQNRTEELGYDLWEEFVVPPYYDSLDLLSARKPRVIIGGRGCGKTMLLRYLCHDTQFSKRRNAVDDDELTRIGLYWRIDTQFAKILTKRGVDENDWMAAFQHMAVLVMSKEILKSLDSVATCCFEGITTADLSRLDFSILSSFNPDTPKDLAELKIFLRKQFNFFQTWAGNTKRFEAPVFLPKGFVLELINEIKEQIPLLAATNFFVYIDEYENLLPEQQRLINTWVKHSEMPLIFNLAMKRYSFEEKNTIGVEQLADIHDYRAYDLESYYNDVIQYDLFAAEILFLKLLKGGMTSTPIVPDDLRSTDTDVLLKRRSKQYSQKVTTYAKKFLPSVPQLELAKEVISDPKLLVRLRESIHDALATKSIEASVDSFIFEEYPEATTIVPALLNRNTNHELIRNELVKLSKGQDNKFTGKTGWIANNFVGCLLLLYEPLGRYCPFYSGFDAFCQMSSNNLRHFLELCNKSISNQTLNHSLELEKDDYITPKNQAESAKQASVGFLKEVKSFGSQGNLLHRFVLRLGTYFSLAHKRPSQSEPEINHFSIKRNSSEKLEKFLKECVKWSVLYEYPITKKKEGTKSVKDNYFEYVLNPIYAPYFHISYRKKRRAEFDEDEITSIVFDDVSKYEQFLKATAAKWRVSNPDNVLSLWSNLPDND